MDELKVVTGKVTKVFFHSNNFLICRVTGQRLTLSGPCYYESINKNYIYQFESINKAEHKKYGIQLQFGRITQIDPPLELDEIGREQEIIEALSPIVGLGYSKRIATNGRYSLDDIRSNPYVVINCDGIGFLTADKIGQEYGFTKSHPARIEAYSLHELERVCSGGRLWVYEKGFLQGFARRIGINYNQAKQILDELILQDKIAVIDGVDNIAYPEERFITLKVLSDRERLITDQVKALLARPGSELSNPIERDSGSSNSSNSSDSLSSLAPDQFNAFTTVRTNTISCITGAPGTGKTYLTNQIIKSFQNDTIITLAAPTGKAAKRMSELTKMEASTIHRLLMPRPVEDKITKKISFRFSVDHNNPISTDVLILDEFSMVDVNLCYYLFRAIDVERTKVIIVGDHYQLPPIGPGAMLYSLLNTVPVTELTEIKRNTGDIVKACHLIKDGKSYMPNEGDFDLDNGRNLIHISTGTPEQTQSTIVSAIRSIAERLNLNPIWDFQVISPFNSKTDLSCKALNEILAGWLNPGNMEFNFHFRTDDKVIQLKNEHIPVIGENGENGENGGDYNKSSKAFCVNGDIGRVVSTTSKDVIVEFFNPTRTVKINAKKHNLAQAYCLTAHKMQGSEIPVVILPLDKSFGTFVTRELFYTAISRAQILCVTIGDFSIVEKIVRNTSPKPYIEQFKKEVLNHE